MPIAVDPPPARGHGPRLSAEDHEGRIVALRADGPAMPSREEDLHLRRAEFDLAIDRRRDRSLLKGLLVGDANHSAPITRVLIAACASESDAAALRAHFEIREEELQGALGR